MKVPFSERTSALVCACVYGFRGIAVLIAAIKMRPMPCLLLAHVLQLSLLFRFAFQLYRLDREGGYVDALAARPCVVGAVRFIVLPVHIERERERKVIQLWNSPRTHRC